MKNNFFKYIFVLVVVALIGYAIFYFYNNQSKTEKQEDSKTEEVSTTIFDDVRVAIVDFDSINPILSKNQDVQEIGRLVYEPLLRVEKDYSLSLCLAKEWAKVDSTTYIIKLKQGIKWHNGMNFNANDVKFTIDQIKSERFDSVYLDNVRAINNIDVVDEYTIRIGLENEIPFFEYNLTFPIMCNEYYSGEDFPVSGKNNNPVGTGKYKLSSVEDSVITLKKNMNWWNIENDNSKIIEITVKKYNSMGEAYNAFKLGNIDLLTTKVLNIDEYIGTAGYKTQAVIGRNNDFIVFNCNHPVLSDSAVRNAISYAIDKYSIISDIYGNKYFKSDFPLDYGSFLYNVEKSDSGFNKEKSKELLQNAGWNFSNGTWSKNINGKYYNTKFNIVVRKNDISRISVAHNIKNQLADIGIILNVIEVNDAQYSNYLNNKNADMLLTGITRGYSPNLNIFFGDGNLANFDNEEVNDIMQYVVNVSDIKKLKEKYERLIEIYETEQPYISLYYNTNTIIYTPNLMGTIEANTYSIFYNISNWYREY